MFKKWRVKKRMRWKTGITSRRKGDEESDNEDKDKSEGEGEGSEEEVRDSMEEKKEHEEDGKNEEECEQEEEGHFLQVESCRSLKPKYQDRPSKVTMLESSGDIDVWIKQV
ncbi:hypothetical protein MRB53_009089 [Persea americana]|uniref:Uncharacterized protein n=1 Tax=Persea americana TaxID=3435 RepID=A0ACC2LN48_PERAE|nr:hypothetical protein MRB53_009089 [Persea americana]